MAPHLEKDLTKPCLCLVALMPSLPEEENKRESEKEQRVDRTRTGGKREN